MKKLSILLLMSAFCVVGSAYAAASNGPELKGLNSKALALMAAGTTSVACKYLPNRGLIILSAAALPSAIEAASKWPLSVKNNLQTESTDSNVETAQQGLVQKKGMMCKRVANIALNGTGAALGWWGLSMVLGQEKATGLACRAVAVVGTSLFVKQIADTINLKNLINQCNN